MKALSDKIRQESKNTRNLREKAWGVSYDESVKIREEQQKTWEKFNFFKNLDKAIKKEK